ncbi:Thymosin beta-10 [Tupaia chinensis]|uniref:Thymosin beta-10 n=1 Tax=Tupaia chinensis TaxID=246437 RepID=L9JDQ0_TUPCH|nr:Thymosin beta-10 [Tupaia chinensis]
MPGWHSERIDYGVNWIQPSAVDVGWTPRTLQLRKWECQEPGLERDASDGFKKKADKPDMGEIAIFDKVKLKKIEMQGKDTLPTKETIEPKKRSEIS